MTKILIIGGASFIESAVVQHLIRNTDCHAVNIDGTYTLLEVTGSHWTQLPEHRKESLCFHNISTDEVYGDLHGTDNLFTETPTLCTKLTVYSTSILKPLLMQYPNSIVRLMAN